MRASILSEFVYWSVSLFFVTCGKINRATRASKGKGLRAAPTHLHNDLPLANLQLSFKSSEYFVYLCKACEGAWITFDDFHHLAYLLLTYNANEHIFLGTMIPDVITQIKSIANCFVLSVVFLYSFFVHN